MDLQLVDQDSKHWHVIQHFELEEILDYAEAWTRLSNDRKKNKRVSALSAEFRKDIGEWTELYGEE